MTACALWSNFLTLVTNDVGSPDSLRTRLDHLTLSEDFASQATPRRRRATAGAEALVKGECSRRAFVFDDRGLNARVNRLPNREVDAHHSQSLGCIRVAGNGDIEGIRSALRSDEATSPQKGLQVAKEAWSVDEDVHAAFDVPEVAATKTSSLTVVRKASASRGQGPVTRSRPEPPPTRRPVCRPGSFP